MWQKNSRVDWVNFLKAEIATEICPNVMHCSKDKIQCEKVRLNKSWDSISNILGTRRFHFLKKINENAIGLQTIPADPYNYGVWYEIRKICHIVWNIQWARDHCIAWNRAQGRWLGGSCLWEKHRVKI